MITGAGRATNVVGLVYLAAIGPGAGRYSNSSPAPRPPSHRGDISVASRHRIVEN
ncbi:hypothetical protein [Mycobacterium sp.]|uniref:hypothetical protein n=1 Tax=Mycobacterium sp. TaxID=1785 RepID=UPI003C763D70